MVPLRPPSPFDATPRAWLAASLALALALVGCASSADTRVDDAGVVDADAGDANPTSADAASDVGVDASGPRDLGAPDLGPGDAGVDLGGSDAGADLGVLADASLDLGGPPTNMAPSLLDLDLTPATADVRTTLRCVPGAVVDADGPSPPSFTYAWWVDGFLRPETGDTLSAPAFGRGSAVACVVTASDGVDVGIPVTSATVPIGNAPPSAASATISPTQVVAGTSLTCTAVQFADADGDADASLVRWSVGGVDIGYGATLAGGFVGGDVVTCTLTPSDGLDAGSPVRASVLVANTPPELYGVNLGPNPAVESDVLVCAPGAVVDADGTTSFTYTYRWWVNGSAIAATGLTLTGDDFSRGDEVECAVRASDGVDDSAEFRSYVVSVFNAPPTIASVTLSPTTITNLSVATCAAVAPADADGDALTFEYGWFVNRMRIAATGAQLGSVYFARGDLVQCTARAYDGSTFGEEVYSPIRTVANSVPFVSAVTVAPTVPYEGDPITCSATVGDYDLDPVTLSYAWYVDGTRVAPIGSSLSSAHFGRGDLVRCRVTPSDGIQAGAPVDSATVTVGDSAPTAPGITLAPSSPVAGSDALTCSVSSPSTDADGDTVTYAFSWTRNGLAYPGATSTATSSVVSAGATLGGETWACSVVASARALASAPTVTAVVTEPPFTYYGAPTSLDSVNLEGFDFVYFQRLDVPADVTLHRLGRITGAAYGADFRLGLYTDAVGSPGTLIASTGPRADTVGVHEVDLLAGPVPLAAGSYWIAWTCGGANCGTRMTQSPTSPAPTNLIWTKARAFGPLPATFTGGFSGYFGTYANVYVAVR